MCSLSHLFPHSLLNLFYVTSGLSGAVVIHSFVHSFIHSTNTKDLLCVGCQVPL